MRTTLFIPTLNEIEGMKIIMPRVKREWVDEILLVDGGSKDGTLEFAQKEGYRIVHQTKTRGITGAYQEGIPYITGDIVVSFSPDGNSIPELIPTLIAKIKEGFDMVIASRYLGGAKSEDDDPVTGFGNWMFTAMINLVFGGRYTDSLVMLRAWRKEIISDFTLMNVQRAGFEPLLSIRCAKEKRKVTEIPGDEPKRIGGVRKMNPIKNGIDILKLICAERFS
jgi:glycosyltransferase involved in cell wall biosynthesis